MRVLWVKKIGAAVIVAFFVFSLLIPNFAAAQWTTGGPDLGVEYPAYSGFSNMDVRITVARVLRVAMGLIGIVMVVIVIYGGYLWMTAGGNEDKVSEAKQWISRGTMGLIVILSAYALTSFILVRLVSASYSGGP